MCSLHGWSEWYYYWMHFYKISSWGHGIPTLNVLQKVPERPDALVELLPWYMTNSVDGGGWIYTINFLR